MRWTFKPTARLIDRSESRAFPEESGVEVGVRTTHELQLFRQKQGSGVEHVDVGRGMELSERGEKVPPVRPAPPDLFLQTGETAAQAGGNGLILVGAREVLLIKRLALDLVCASWCVVLFYRVDLNTPVQILHLDRQEQRLEPFVGAKVSTDPDEVDLLRDTGSVR